MTISQTLDMKLFPGQTGLKLNIFTLGNNTPLNGSPVVVTETGTPGDYQAVVVGSIIGVDLDVYVFGANDPTLQIAYGTVTLPGITGTYRLGNGIVAVDISGVPPIAIIVNQALSAAAQVTNQILLKRGDTFLQALQSIGDVAASVSKSWWTAKTDKLLPDSQSLIQIDSVLGLVVFNQADVTNPTIQGYGSLSIQTQIPIISLLPVQTEQLDILKAYWDYQVLLMDGVTVRTIYEGELLIKSDITQTRV